MKNYDAAFARLAKSKFRSRFHLSAFERGLVNEKGMETIRAHCAGFIETRLAPAYPPNDGKQTPMRGHPVFVAQHGVAIPAERQQGIVDFLMAWIEREMQLQHWHYTINAQPTFPNFKNHLSPLLTRREKI